MIKQRHVLMGLLCAVGLTTVSAKPYLQIQGGIPTIKGAKKIIDGGVARASLGYAIQYQGHLSLLGEVGVSTGTQYDAGILGGYPDDHLKLHIGSGVDAMVGMGYRTGRVELDVLGGVRMMKLSTINIAATDVVSKTAPKVAVRLSYLYTPNVRFNVGVAYTAGNTSTATFDKWTSAVTLGQVPSTTTFLVGVQLAL